MARSMRPRHTGRIVVTERTSKSLKLQILLAWFFILGGIGLAIAGPSLEPLAGQSGVIECISIASITFGVGWYVITKIRIWWQHA